MLILLFLVLWCCSFHCLWERLLTDTRQEQNWLRDNMINELLSVPWDGLDQHARMISCLSHVLDGRDGQQEKCCRCEESAQIRVLRFL